MGDHLGSPGVVDSIFSSKTETTGSRLISEVKHRRAWVVLGWVGDHLGSPSVVDSIFSSKIVYYILLIDIQ